MASKSKKSSRKPEMPERDEYLLGHSATEEERLRRQSEELAPDSRRLLDQLNLLPGSSAIDIGCGPMGILDLLSDRVGAKGRVVGLDRSEATVRLARKLVVERHLTNVEVLMGNAKATGLPRASFDLVHARLVLVNVPEPERVVEEMVALARPGGIVASHEADWIGWLCDPPSRAWDRLIEVIDAYSRANGIDLFVGRKTHRMLRSAGLVDVQVNPVMHVFPRGHPRRMTLWNFMQNVRDRIVARGLTSEAEFNCLATDLERQLGDPDTLVFNLYFEAWGRKPE